MANKEEAVVAEGRSVRTLLVTDHEGDFKLELNEDDTVTFGPTIPYTPKDGYRGSHGGYSLRVYEGKSKAKLKAVFPGVQGFRDISIQMFRKIATEEVRTVWKSDEKGYRIEEEAKRASHWEDEVVAALPPKQEF